MRDVRIRTKVIIGFAAAFAVAVGLSFAMKLAAGGLSRELENVSTRQLPARTALSALQAGFKDGQRFLNAQALARSTAEVLASPDCRGCHDGGVVFADLGGQALERVQKAAAAMDAVGHSAAVAARWPKVKADVQDWLARARRLGELVGQRDRLLSAGAVPGVAGRSIESQVWEEWSGFHNLSGPLDDAIGALDAALDAEVAGSQQARLLAERREAMVGTVGVLAVGALLLLLALLVGRSVSQAVKTMVVQTAELTAAAQAGELSVRGDPALVPSEFRPVVEGINRTLDQVVSPLRVSADCVARIARGDIPAPIQEEFHGDFATLRDNLNDLIRTNRGLLAEMARMAEGQAAGDTDVRVDQSRFEGAFGALAAGVNGCAQQYASVLGEVLDILGRYGAGDFTPELRPLPGKLARANQGLDLLRQNLRAVAEDVTALGAKAASGQLSARADAGRFQGDWHRLVETLNRTLDALTLPAIEAARHVDGIARGEPPPPIEQPWPGDFLELRDNLNRCSAAVGALLTDADALAQAAAAGRLSTRADATRHLGDFRRVIEGVNQTLDSTLRPLEEADRVLERLAARDLRARMRGSYQGDHARMSRSINAAAEALHQALAQADQTSAQVLAAANQIAASSQTVASGASEQAAGLSQASDSLGDLTRMSARSRDAAGRADGMARAAQAAATDSARAMEAMAGAMGRIRASAESTSQIIKDINEIAFQTNLLALNAAVEAARAGDAGRGFAVVAEEVRSLALRSKDAAQRSEDLIRQSVGQAEEGEETSRKVGAKLSEMGANVAQVTEAVGEIAGVAVQQTASVEAVAGAVREIGQVTQQNAASAEQSSAAAEELTARAQELAGIVGSFELEGPAAVMLPAAPEGAQAARRGRRPGIGVRLGG